MKKEPEAPNRAFRKKLRAEGVARREFADCLKWLRYYLGFCYEFRHPFASESETANRQRSEDRSQWKGLQPFY